MIALISFIGIPPSYIHAGVYHSTLLCFGGASRAPIIPDIFKFQSGAALRGRWWQFGFGWGITVALNFRNSCEWI